MKGQRTLGETYTSGYFGTKIPDNWEAHPMNSTVVYNNAPSVKWSQYRGVCSKDKFLSRSFNRRLN